MKDIPLKVFKLKKFHFIKCPLYTYSIEFIKILETKNLKMHYIMQCYICI